MKDDYLEEMQKQQDKMTQSVLMVYFRIYLVENKADECLFYDSNAVIINSVYEEV